MNVRAGLFIAGKLAGIWAGLWMAFALLELNNYSFGGDIHPWMVWVSALVLMLLIQLIVGKIKPGLKLKEVLLFKLRRQAELMMLVLACDLAWAAILEITFPWPWELVALALFDFVYVSNENSKGTMRKGLDARSVMYGGAMALVLALMILLRDKLGILMDWISRGLGWVVSVIGKVIKAVVLFFSGLGGKHAVSYDVSQAGMEGPQVEVTEQMPTQYTQIFKYFLIGIGAIVALVFLAVLVYVVIIKIKELFSRSGKQEVIEGVHKETRKPLRELINLIRQKIRKIKSRIKISTHKDSVGFALYRLEKKYSKNRKLRRREAETPVEFIERIARFEEESGAGGESGSDGNGRSNSGSSNREYYARLAYAATRAAYDDGFSWLDKL